MLHMVMTAGDKEQILDLIDTLVFVLIQSCNMTLRHQDLRNPDAQYILRETVNAIKTKIEKKPSELANYNRQELNKWIAHIDDLLNSVAQE